MNKLSLTSHYRTKSLRDGSSGDRKPVRVRFSSPVQTGPGDHPTSCTVGSGSLFRWWRGRGVALSTHPPTSSKEVEERTELCLYLFIWTILAFSTNTTKVPHKQKINQVHFESYFKRIILKICLRLKEGIFWKKQKTKRRQQYKFYQTLHSTYESPMNGCLWHLFG